MTNFEPSTTLPYKSALCERRDATSSPLLDLTSPAQFFENEEIGSLTQRRLFDAPAGVSIRFQGKPGRGKTSLSLEITCRIGSKVSAIAGQAWLDAQAREVAVPARSLTLPGLWPPVAFAPELKGLSNIPAEVCV